jgi:hypothetical protein
MLDGLVHLRRAERAMPGNRDVVAVRALLSRELGETVSRRLAADLLGVSHTALRRWIDAGDLPVVYAPSGRMQVPVDALLDLHEKVVAERDSGRRGRHVLEPAMTAGRARAEELDPSSLVDDTPADNGHDRARRRALAYHRALARQLRRPMVDQARHLLWTWRDLGRIDDRWADRWEEILERPVRDIAQTIAEDTTEAADLRQSSPFAGMLSEAERRKIVAEIR